MSNVIEAVQAFSKLLTVSYDITLGRKGVLKELHLTFSKEDAFHLLGLHYLKDLEGFDRPRTNYFDRILDGRLSETHLKTSVYYSSIEPRINVVTELQNIIESNDTIFRYEKSKVQYSSINAEYLLENRRDESVIYTFLAQTRDQNYFCISMFPKDRTDYTRNLASWTLLKKVKNDHEKQESVILYDRLS